MTGAGNSCMACTIAENKAMADCMLLAHDHSPPPLILLIIRKLRPRQIICPAHRHGERNTAFAVSAKKAVKIFSCVFTAGRIEDG